MSTLASVAPITGTPASAFRPLASVARVSYQEGFLIEDLLTSRMTFLAGEPKAGKSLFAAGMIRALLEGKDEFLGLQIHRHLDHVVYGYTDDGADEELRERFWGTDAEARVSIVPMHDTGNEHLWSELTRKIIAERPGLLVVDTVLGSLPPGDDIASGVTAQQVVARVRPISEAGVPVLLITHTPKGAGEGVSVSSSVIGGRAMAGGVRGVIALRKSKAGRRVQTSINRARSDLDIAVDVHRESERSEVPVWSRRVEVRQGRPWKPVLIERILDEQPNETTRNALATRYTGELTVGKRSISDAIAEALTHDGERWVRKAA